jgi:Leucine-rich repeat (LRR) protein
MFINIKYSNNIKETCRKFNIDEWENIENIIELSCNTHICRLPKDINKLVNLQCLKLEGNRFRHFPTEIFGLKNLKKLSIMEDYILNIPEEISELTNLEHLTLRSSGVKTIPESIGNLVNLRYLDLAYNFLSRMPVQKSQRFKLGHHAQRGS